VSVHPPPSVGRAGHKPGGNDAILFAVMDDVRHTLRMSWVDPALRSVSSYPMFFTAAWAATKPNMTRSFALGSERLRTAAVEVARSAPSVQPIHPTPDGSAVADLSVPERERLIRTVQAVHHSSAKVGLVLQAWTVLARRRRIAGTGQEEPPAKRGIPSWQEGLSAMPRSLTPEAEAFVDDATIELGLSTTPAALQAAAVWPHFLEEAWRRLQPISKSAQWREAVARLRRSGGDVLRSLPHPMDLQWDVLGQRGLTEDRREVIADHLSTLAAAAPVNMLLAAHLWCALGSPELPGET